MQRLHARYPFLEAARETVATETVDLATVVEQERAVVERARKRVITALEDGEIGEPHRDPRTELLSYPVARVLVSMVDERVLVRKYARAEAATAHERFTADLESTTELKSVESTGLELETVLDEFSLQEAVTPAPASASRGAGTAAAAADGDDVDDVDEFRIDVGTYLPLAADLWDDEWGLVNQPLTNGEVPVARDDLLVLLREAIRDRIEEGLPFEVPDPIATRLEDDVAAVRDVLADLDLTRDIDTVVPELFPPCMQALLDQIQKGEHLPHHSRFAITAFLSSIGMTTDEIVELYRVNSSFGEEMTRYQTDHIRGETSPTEYSPPSCATMQSYGDCVNKDDLCERIPHPMAYYEERIDEADEDELEDWRTEDAEADADGSGKREERSEGTGTVNSD
ncbi:DNA primase regulatory subunit PriL [Natrialba asiatica]|uniref:DNA primase large subunit PriL n=1 Tax=Natrialba asiatica (strain ATCC 700177 / DSM 12278 / JCM 9576 / FERM P-10747 / NBRC 102637 / 172P1) TaxID=29540 RepID=M0AGH4_NATA1|nr:DNA primase regulatory subunit PriL [Natrialba asiatica]ELY97830.1 DNA primase large subunit [Natrialba asiatica DSM 12278]